MNYWIPAQETTIEIEVQRSRFIATALYVESVEDTRWQLAQRRKQMPDANHHVYAFRIGGGNSIIEGLSDAGEPSGTSGPPVMAVLRGSGLGDTLIIVTRYFGGIKLGTGGLVRAYTDAAVAVLRDLKRVEKVSRAFLRLNLPYPHYNGVKRILADFDAEILTETFGEFVVIDLSVAEQTVEKVKKSLIDGTHGQIDVLSHP
jgi:uncharacterized YigZ family protein